ncbi:MAG TPA: intradiol ring-cleavage dioxygenase [Nitrospira sp.]|nr:intradiol ring-cleavage dioxygenase [Nitrospira sp.]
MIRSRREVIGLLAGSAAWWTASALLHWSKAWAQDHSCVIRPEQTEGPYFVDERLERSDLRSDPSDGRVKSGTPLHLAVVVSRLSPEGCQPIEGAQVDIWHCDALGRYSDVDDPYFTTLGQKFLRGYQLTDAQGRVRFLTIYPGWYPGRTVHIHGKVRTHPTERRGYAFTWQMYFPDPLTDQVHAGPPYAAQGPRRVRNADDRIFRRGGDRLMLVPSPAPDGFTAVFMLALDIPSTTRS